MMVMFLVSKFSHIIFMFSLPACTTVVCNYFVNNGLHRLKIPLEVLCEAKNRGRLKTSHTYGTMILEKYMCKQFDKLVFNKGV